MQVRFAKRVVGVEMKLHLMGQDQIMDCRGYLDTMAGYLRSPIAVPPEYQGTVDLSRVLMLGVMKDEETYEKFMMGKFSAEAPDMLSLGRSFVNPGRSIPSGKGLASEGTLLYAEALGNLGLAMAVMWCHVYRGIFDQFCMRITSHRSVLREISAEVFTYYLEGMLTAGFADLRLHRVSSQYPGHSLTGPVRVRNFFQSLLGGLLDRLEDTMERLAMERKYETRMILPLSGVFGGPGTRSSLGGQGQIGKSLVGPAGAGTGVGRQAQGRVMCAIHVAGQLGLKNLSNKPFVCQRTPCVRHHLDLSTITKKAFEGRIGEVATNMQVMVLDAAKKFKSFKK
jgi:hypothetical protein